MANENSYTNSRISSKSVLTIQQNSDYIEEFSYCVIHKDKAPSLNSFILNDVTLLSMTKK